MGKRNLTLKLLVDKKDQKVLFAEAGKETVDFLFSLLALPLGTVARLLAAEGMVGSVGKLCDGLERLDGTYIRAGFDKNTLLKPTISSNTSCQTTFLLECSQSPPARAFYRCDGSSYSDGSGYYRSQCSSSTTHVTDGREVPCPGCKRPMTSKMTYVPPKTEMVAADTGEGYVQGIVTYMVMDDLAVEPMSAISCITLLNQLHVGELGSLEERTVELGLEEEMIFRGTDTTARLTEFAMAELVLNPTAQARLRAELDSVADPAGAIPDADEARLPYLQAVVKETLRLHPPGPLLSWARLSTADVPLGNGMVVPAGTTAMVNMWAITHDPAIWEAPCEFRPGRFLPEEGGSEVDVRGGDLTLAPFGAGRRVCPGKNLALATVGVWVARLVHQFVWAAAEGEPVDMEEVLKLSLELKKPLVVVAMPRTSVAA